MARRCDICGKGPMFGNTVSHSNHKEKRVWKPNLKRVKALVNGEVKYIKVCMSCLKSGKVQLVR